MRWQQHKCYLRQNKNGCLLLQNAWNKYGENAFEFYLLFDNLLENELDILEQQCINWYKSLGLSYNLESGGHKQKRLSEETRRKISEAHKGKTLTKEHKDNLAKAKHFVRKYCFISPDGEMFVGENVRAFANEKGLNPRSLIDILNGRRKSYRKWKKGDNND